jgi:hypothetical protein
LGRAGGGGGRCGHGLDMTLHESLFSGETE